MLRDIDQSYQPVNYAQMAAVLADIMPLYWESNVKIQDLNRQYLVWFEALKAYSQKTIVKVAHDWVKGAKRKPTPADFLELCRDIDPVPSQAKRLAYLVSLPIHEERVKKGKMLGCPILLSRLMRYANGKGIPFHVDEQMEYLGTGIVPGWYPVTEPDTTEKPPGPTRDELLAQLTPEARVQAVKDRDDWKKD